MLENKDQEYKIYPCPRWVAGGKAYKALPKVLCAAAVSPVTGTRQLLPGLAEPPLCGGCVCVTGEITVTLQPELTSAMVFAGVLG